MKIIKLTKGLEAIIDDDDFDVISKLKWRTKKGWGETHYAYAHGPRNNGKRKEFNMHRMILGAVKGQYVDHINGNGLDNRKENLRFCSNRENSFNSKHRVNAKSKYKGVSWCSRTKRWQTALRIAKKSIWLGRFKIQQEAAKAYNEAAIKYFGEFARLNDI